MPGTSTGNWKILNESGLGTAIGFMGF